MPTGQFK